MIKFMENGKNKDIIKDISEVSITLYLQRYGRINSYSVDFNRGIICVDVDSNQPYVKDFKKYHNVIQTCLLQIHMIYQLQ